MEKHLAYVRMLFNQGNILIGGPPRTGQSVSWCSGWIRKKRPGRSTSMIRRLSPGSGTPSSTLSGPACSPAPVTGDTVLLICKPSSLLPAILRPWLHRSSLSSDPPMALGRRQHWNLPPACRSYLPRAIREERATGPAGTAREERRGQTGPFNRRLR
jgi:hypothetical protein